MTLRYESEFAADHDDLSAKVYMAIGGLEGPDSIADVHNLAQALQDRQYPSLEMFTTVFDDEGHMSVVPAIITRGLRMVFSEDRP